MSSILQKLNKNPSLLIDYLEKCEDQINAAKEILDLDDKVLEKLCKDHPKYVAEYKRKLYEIKCVEDLFNNNLEAVYSEKWKELNSNMKKILTQKDIHVYIQSDNDYRELRELVLEITFIKKIYESICEAFDALGYSLNNIVKIRIASLEDMVI